MNMSLFEKRFTTTEKMLFLTTLGDSFKDLGFPTHFANERKGGKSNHILFAGDAKNADTYLITYYDTPEKSPWNAKYEPFHLTSRFQNERRMILIKGIFFTLAGLLWIYLGITYFWGKSSFDFWGILPIIFIFISIYFGLFWKGVGEKNNQVRNTSSVEAFLGFAEKIPQKNRKKFCFVFTNIGVTGDQIINEAIALSTKKNIVYLDVAGAKGSLFLEYRDDSNRSIEKRLQKFSNPPCWEVVSQKDPALEENLYTNAKTFTLFACGEKNPAGKIISDTRVYDPKNVLLVQKALAEYLG